MFKRIKFLFLLAALLCVSLTSCGNGEEADTASVSDDNAAENAETVSDEAEETVEESDEVAGPDKTDLEGYSFRIVTSVWYDNDQIIAPEEITGEVINDSVYNSNLSVMDDYNCNFVSVVLTNESAVGTAVSDSVKAGTDDYDISYNHDNVTVNTALDGNYLNIRRSSVFNFDAPWWTRTADDFTIGNGLYFVSNYATYSPLYFGFVLVYNKDIAENYHIEIPYDDIFAGNWYLDDMIELTTDVNTDLDGDGVITLGKDQYGFMASNLGLVNFQVSLGNAVLGKDEDGYMTMSFDQERMYTMLEKFEKLMENGINKDVDGEWGYGTKYFAEGQVLFCYPQILDIPAMLHDTDVHFGSIPAPKLDESQEEYVSGAFDVYWAVPKTAVANLDTIATVMEALAHSCYYNVLPGAYETTLMVKFSESEVDAKAYEIVRDSMCVDVGYALKDKTSTSGLVYALSRMTANDMASSIKKQEKVITKTLAKINEKFAEMNAEEYE